MKVLPPLPFCSLIATLFFCTFLSLPAESFREWLTTNGIPENQQGTRDDFDGDGLPHFLEYSLGLSPVTKDLATVLEIGQDEDSVNVTFEVPTGVEDASYQLEISSNLGEWVPEGDILTSEEGAGTWMVAREALKRAEFFRIRSFNNEENAAPIFTSTPPGTTVKETAFQYAATATDEDEDRLAFSLAAGPGGMSINSTTGLVSWTPGENDLGSHSVILKVDDGHNGMAFQNFTLTVTEEIPNRPPSFTSTPVVTVASGGSYSYPLTASDPDGDTVTFSLPTGPGGLALNGANLTWQPGVSDVGSQAVVIEASDGRGGEVTQEFSILVNDPPGNRAPVFTSTPERNFLLPAAGNIANGNVSPSSFLFEGDELQSGTASITLPEGLPVSGAADIVITVDQSGSMNTEHEWLGGMVTELENELLARGIGPNRYVLGGFSRSRPHLFNLGAFYELKLYDPSGTEVFEGNFEELVSELKQSLVATMSGRYTAVFSLLDNSPRLNLSLGIDTTPSRLDLENTGFDVIYEGQLAPDETASFPLTAMGGTVFSFDSLIEEGPGIRRQLINSDIESTGVFINTEIPKVIPATGNYSIAVTNTSGSPRPYRFRLVSAREFIPLNSRVRNVISEGLGNHLFFLPTSPGDDLFYRNLGSDQTGSFSFLNPDLAVIGGQRLDRTTSEAIVRTGQHYLLIRGDAPDGLVTYDFELSSNPDESIPTSISYNTPITGSLTRPGQQKRFTLDAEAGDLLFYDGLSSDPDMQIRIFDPLSVQKLSLPSGLFRFDRDRGPIPLTTDGLHEIILSGRNGATGDFAFTLHQLADAEELTLNSETTISLAEARSARLFSFEATPGKRFFFEQISGSNAPSWEVIQPDGVSAVGETSLKDLTFTAAQSGTHTLIIFGQANGDTAPITFRASTAPLPAPITITIGETISGTVTPSAPVSYTFSGDAGEILIFDGISGDGATRASLHAPDGSDIFTFQRVNSDRIDPVELPKDGVYRLIINNSADEDPFSFRFLAASTAPLLSPGVSPTLALTPGEITLRRIAATTGQRITLRSDSAPAGANGLWRFAGSHAQFNRAASVFNDIAETNIIAPGNQLLVVSARDTSPAFDFTFSVLNVSDAPVAKSGLDQAITGTLAANATTQIHSFNAPAGTTIFLDNRDGAGSSIRRFITAPSGDIVSNLVSSNDARPFVLTESGTYEITFENRTAAAIPYSAVLNDLASAPAITRATSVITSLADNEAQLFTFTAEAGERLSLTHLNSTDGGRIEMIEPDGSSIKSDDSNDFQEQAFDTDGTFTLLISNDGSPAQLDLEFQLTAQTDTSETINFGDLIEGTITSQGDSFTYTFEGTAGERLFFDGIGSPNQSVRLFSILSPTDETVERSVNLDADSTRPLTLKESGTYRLRISATDETTGDFSFRLHRAETELVLGTPTNLSIPPGQNARPNSQSLFFTLDATAGQELTLTPSPGDTVALRLYLPDNSLSRLINLGTSSQQLEIPRTGTHLVQFIGKNTTSTTSTFTTSLREITATPLVLDEATTATIAAPGASIHFSFFAESGTTILYRPMNRTATSAATARLQTPGGDELFRLGFDRSSGVITLPQTGYYHFWLDPSTNTVGNYQFRILNIDNLTPLTLDEPIDENFNNDGDVLTFSFEASAGEMITFNRNPSLFGSSAEVSTATDRLTLSNFGTEDGWGGLDIALDLDFLPGAAVNMILVTDEDRDQQVAGLSFDGLLTRLNAQNVLLNSVVEASFVDGNSDLAVGVDSIAQAYLPDGAGGFDLSAGGLNTGGFGTTKADYIDLAWATGGAAWDLNQLREGGLPAQSFTSAFVSIKAQEILTQLAAVEVISSDPNAPLNILTGPQMEVTGSALDFDFQIQPDGTNRNFDLLFIRPNSNTILGSIPVTLRSPYLYDVDVNDPDDDPVSVSSLLAGDFDPASNRLTFFPEDGPGDYDFSLLAKDNQGATTRQSFTVTVSESAQNSAPVFTSTAPGQAGVDRPFQYQATANDPDGDRVQFFLESAPEGLGINRLTGLLTWLPDEDDIGPHRIEITALDSRGGAATQPFTLVVNRDLGNRNPVFTSNPPGIGANFNYRPTATDPDSDEVKITLALSPDGMIFDPTNGLLAWTPNDSQQGQHQVVLRATDPFGGSAFQSFTLDVAGPNSAPRITSDAPTKAFVNIPFSYLPTIVDPENDPLSFTLINAPAGVAVDDFDGRITVTPTVEDNLNFTLRVSDSFNTVEQEIALNIIDPGPNQGPVFESTPRTRIALGKDYYYQVVVSDPEGQPVEVILEEGPDEMFLLPGELIEWKPTGEDFGLNTVVLRADDGRGGIVQQSFVIEVASTDANLPPGITTTPPPSATIGESYLYRAAATDPEGDPFIWRLDTAPEGMEVDPASGLVSFTPSESQIGEHAVALRTLDSQGASSVQSFTLNVRGANLPPVWTSLPRPQAALRQLYQYIAQADDPNGDVVTFTLDEGPSGATITPSGLLSWTPAERQRGEHSLVLTASDPRGASSTQSFSVTATIFSENALPVITSTPAFVSQVGQPYQYQVVANDPEGADLLYDFLTHPSEMVIEPNGLVSWTPNAAQVGQNAVSVLVTDPAGDSAYQAYTVTVLNRPGSNQTPVITNTINQAAAVGQLFSFDLLAFDPDGDPLSYQIATGPEEMEIDSNGGITWTPTAADAGTAQLAIRVSDSLGAFATLNVALPVIDDSDGPFVAIDFSENPIDPGTEVTITVRASDPLGIASLVVTADGTPVALDANRQFRLRPADFGNIEIIATASDPSGNESSVAGTLNVLDTSDINAPTVLVESPGPGADIATPTEIFATIRDTNLASYELSLQALEGGERRVIFTGTEPAENAIIGTLDPTIFANGPYLLRLRATDTGGLSSTDEFTISISGDLKLGDFQIAFEDLSIPLTGTPIVINRIYDSFAANQEGDFGHGWSLDIADTRLRSTRSLAGQNQSDEVFGAFRPGERVFVTAPGGRRLGFTFEPEINNPFFPIFDPKFVPDPGVTATLTVERVDLRFDDVLGEFVTYIERLPYNPAAPAFGQFYTLTTAEGIAFRINAFTGDLETLTDPNGNQLTFSNEGIESSTGTSIDFERDEAGRITAIIDPMGERILYAYSDEGDLTSVTNREGNVTTFTYHNDRPHFLHEIIDPLGRTGRRSTYDENGRLVTQINANGQPTTYTYDPANAIQTATDSLGRTNILEFDPRGNLVKTTDAAGGITLQTYSENDFLESITDPLGNTTLFEINEKGFLTSQTDPLGNVATVTYDNFGNPVTAIDPLGNVTSRTYDEFGNQLTGTDASGSTTTFVHDGKGNLLTLTDAAENVTNFTYGNMGNRLSTTRRDSENKILSATTRTFDTNGNRLSETTTMTTPDGPRVVSLTFEYDAEGNLTRSVDGEGNVSTQTFTATGMVAEKTDAKNRSTSFAYNAADKLTALTLPDGSVNNYSFDSEQRLIGNLDPFNRSTRLEYNPNNRVSAAVYPDATPGTEEDNPRVTYEHNSAGRQTAIIDENGNRTGYEFNAAGRRTAITDAAGNTTSFTYDAAGHRITQTDPLGRTTRFLYDPLDRLIRTTFADGSTTARSFDSLGNFASETDQAGRVTRYEYDARGNLTAVINPANGRTEYEYDELNNRVLQRDALGRVTRFEYDALGQLTATVRPSGARETHTYDETGNRASTTRFGGGTLSFEYDSSDRLISTNYPDGTAVDIVEDELDLTRKETVTGPDNRVISNQTYQLDPRLRIVAKSGINGADLDYTRDAVGNITALSTENGTTSYQYNSLNQLNRVTDADGNVTSYTYDSIGNLIRTIYPNGVRETRSYDDLNRIVGKDYQKDGVSISRFDYVLDPSGLRTSVLDQDGTLTEYTYDSAKRLVSEVAATRTITYRYDAVGNRLEKNDSLVGLTTYSYNSDDQLTSRTTAGQTTNFNYDGDGNLLSEITDAANRSSYTWNSRGQLESITRISSGTSSTRSFTYDARGNRISETVNGVSIIFTIDDARRHAQVIEDLDFSGNILARYTLGIERISQTRGNTTHYYLSDALGSTRALSNAAGTITDNYQYDAFGNLTDSSGSTENRYLFTGESQDRESGLVHLRAREYDPANGRFLSTDPFEGLIEQPVSLHRYLYANADPVNVTDPSGKFSLVSINVSTAIVINFMKNDISAGSDAIFKITRVSNNLLNVGLTQEEMGLLMIIDDVDGGIDIYNAGLEYKIIALEQIHAAISEFNSARLEYLASALDPLTDFINGLPIVQAGNAVRDFAEGVISFGNNAGTLLGNLAAGEFSAQEAIDLVMEGRATIGKYKEAKKHFE